MFSVGLMVTIFNSTGVSISHSPDAAAAWNEQGNMNFGFIILMV
jgi:hypothetical protein